MADKNIIKDTSDVKEDLLPVVTYEIEGQSKTLLNEKESAEVEYRAKKFVDLVQHGEDPKKAAKSVGASIEQITGRDGFGKAVNKLIGDYALNDKVRAELVKASLNKILIENTSSTDTEKHKVALAAAKQIAQEPNIALSNESAVTINLGELADTIKDVKIEGIPDFIEVTAVKEVDSGEESNK